MSDEDRDVCGSYAGNAGRLPDGLWTHSGKLFPRFKADSAYAGIVQIAGNREFLEPRLLVDLGKLPGEIPAIMRFDFDVAPCFAKKGRHRGSGARDAIQV